MTIIDQVTANLSVADPTTGELIGEVTSANYDDVVEGVTSARAAQRRWAGIPAEKRGKYLHAMADALADAADELANLNHRETGKLLKDCHGGIDAGAATLRQYAELGPLHRGHSLRGDSLAADYTVTRPRGVVVALTPWNDPVAVAMGLIGAALVTGNTVVHKPSERNPHLGKKLGEVLSEVLPSDVLTTLIGAGDVGQLLTADSRVDAFAHVGSTATGVQIAAAATETGAHVIRENGGNDALIIDDTVDPAWAAQQTALGCFVNAGQICTSVERVFVDRAIAGQFLEHLISEAQRWGTTQSVVDVAHRSQIHDQVSAAVKDGAQLLTGGVIPDGPGAHYPATVISNCQPTMTVMREETFGPVAPVFVIDSFEEGLQLADNDRYGLAATVLTKRLDRALQAVDTLQVGTVKVNNVFGGAPGGSAQPHRDSGDGFGYGPELLDEMTTTSVVHLEFPGGVVQ